MVIREPQSTFAWEEVPAQYEESWKTLLHCVNLVVVKFDMPYIRISWKLLVFFSLCLQ